MATAISMDAVRRRRAAYHRAQTISLLPEDPIPEIDNELDEEVAHINECSKLIKRVDRYDHSDASPFAKVGELNPVVRPKEIVQKSSKVASKSQSLAKHTYSVQRYNDRQSTDVKCSCKPDPKAPKQEARKILKKKDMNEINIPQISVSGRARAVEFQKRRSITISTDEPLLPNYEPERKSPFPLSPTAASSMLNRFKERIQQSLFLSSESQGAALLHQRRERANQYVKKVMRQQRDVNFESIRLSDLSSKKRKRHKERGAHAQEDGSSDDELHLIQKNIASDPGVYTPLGDMGMDDTLPPEVELANARAAKEAFRRRSISEDVYDRLPHTYIVERHAITASASACIDSRISSQSNSGGIVCSDDDLHFILNTFKHDKTPRPSSDSSRSKDNVDNASPNITEEPSCSYKITQKVKHSKSGQCDTDTHKRDNDAASDDSEDEENQQPPEIVFDEHGQTWDVYGAEFDPEILGEAIQRHLEKIMSQMSKRYSSSRRKKSKEDTPSLKKRQGSTANEADRNWWKILCPFPILHREPTVC